MSYIIERKLKNSDWVQIGIEYATFSDAHKKACQLSGKSSLTQALRITDTETGAVMAAYS